MHGLSTTLYDVPKKPLHLKPPHGQRLVRRRDELKISQGDIEERTNNVIYKQLMYRLENGQVKPRRLTADQLHALALALEWTIDELREALDLGPAPKMPEDAVIQASAFPVGELSMPYVLAGAGLPQWNDDPSSHVSINLPETRRRDIGKLFAVRVVGNSMLTYASDGDLVVFECSDHADLGRIVAVHVPDDGLIVKRFFGVSDTGRLLLGNDNRDVVPNVFEAPDGARVYGMSIGKWESDL